MHETESVVAVSAPDASPSTSMTPYALAYHQILVECSKLDLDQVPPQSGMHDQHRRKCDEDAGRIRARSVGCRQG